MRKLLGSITSLFLFASVVAKADLINNGQFTGTPNTTGTYSSFSDPAYTGDFYDPTTISGWTFSNASGILKYPGFGQGYFPAAIPNATSQFAFIQNVVGGNAITQTVVDAVGQHYAGSFSATGNNNSPSIPIVLSIGGLPVQTFAATYGWKTYNFNFTGTGSDAISFSSNGPFNYNGFSGAAGLTNVSVNATPEPSSIMLLGTGILGLAATGRRKLFKA